MERKYHQSKSSEYISNNFSQIIEFKTRISVCWPFALHCFDSLGLAWLCVALLPRFDLYNRNIEPMIMLLSMLSTLFILLM